MATGASAEVPHKEIKETVKGTPKSPQNQCAVREIKSYVAIVVAVHILDVPTVQHSSRVELVLLSIVPIPDVTNVGSDHGEGDTSQQDNHSFPCFDWMQGMVQTRSKDDVIVLHPLNPVLPLVISREVKGSLGEEGNENFILRAKVLLAGLPFADETWRLDFWCFVLRHCLFWILQKEFDGIRW